ncbi:hypothetical protein BVC80_833g6 [Macleaya cordata]|uniref:G-patch domain n=1 Tax=Macleaya cordata TaxID=56857 RepID=A0A200Q415_MACCD|nr:hypothetical protein BVC80_833g6 [Macleaya cordata]
MRRTKANVSVWGLLEASTKHRDAVLEALNSIQVPTVITPNELVATITHIHSMPTISFSDEDLPSEGARHNRALNITIGWNHLVIPLVLIDNGFGVNICTLEIAKLMGLSSADMSFEDATVRIVKGFDNGKKSADGGRPWLHQHKAVASTLHQKVKFPFKDLMVVIFGDNDEAEEIANRKGKNIVPMIVPEKQLCNFTKEEVNLFVRRPPRREKIPNRFNHGNRRIAYVLRSQNFFLGMGLGRNLHARIEPLCIKKEEQVGTFGLGYQPTEEEITKFNTEKSRRAQIKNKGDQYVS